MLVSSGYLSSQLQTTGIKPQKLMYFPSLHCKTEIKVEYFLKKLHSDHGTVINTP